ncbi:MAG: hypothetical protein MAG715_00904 [Methanonatronarchaeales archaeon]|nr:hypothetical protein [Methanonatronarchaeales archaeon]
MRRRAVEVLVEDHWRVLKALRALNGELYGDL